MVKNNMNYLAMLIGAAAAWLFGAVYYGLLGTYWVTAVGKPAGEQMSYLPYVTSFVAELVMAWVLAGMVGRLGAAQVTVKNALIYAVSGWLGFIITVIATSNIYAARPFSLTLLDGGHWLGVSIILGAVIGAMGVRK